MMKSYFPSSPVLSSTGRPMPVAGLSIEVASISDGHIPRSYTYSAWRVLGRPTIQRTARLWEAAGYGCRPSSPVPGGGSAVEQGASVDGCWICGPNFPGLSKAMPLPEVGGSRSESSARSDLQAGLASLVETGPRSDCPSPAPEYQIAGHSPTSAAETGGPETG